MSPGSSLGDSEDSRTAVHMLHEKLWQVWPWRPGREMCSSGLMPRTMQTAERARTQDDSVCEGTERAGHRDSLSSQGGLDLQHLMPRL